MKHRCLLAAHDLPGNVDNDNLALEGVFKFHEATPLYFEVFNSQVDGQPANR